VHAPPERTHREPGAEVRESPGVEHGDHEDRGPEQKYRKFSLGLDECTVSAAAFALKKLRDSVGKPTIEIPVLPLILGGDDLTIICDGQYAIKFTEDFLTRFVEETKKPEIQHIFPKGIELGICAGIAIIKPHYPFHQAYHLAEQLLLSAK
jgi:hypothetical protein